MAQVDEDTMICTARSSPSLVPLAQQLPHHHHYNAGQQFYTPSKSQYASTLYTRPQYNPEPTSVLDLCSPPLDSMNLQQSIQQSRKIRAFERAGSPLNRARIPTPVEPTSVLDLCSPPLDSMSLQHSRHAREHERVIPLRRAPLTQTHHALPPPLKVDDFHSVQQVHHMRQTDQSLSAPSNRILDQTHCVPTAQSGLPPLKLDDFNNIGFVSGSGYAGNEWMDLMTDLQPCESTESSALPLVVNAWDNDFTLPRELRVRSEGEDLLPSQRAGIQEEEYQNIQHRLHTLHQLGHVQEEPSYDATAHTEHTKKEMEREDRETESDYSGGIDKDHSVHLVHLLLECAELMDASHPSAATTLRHLRDLSSPYGDPMQRVAAYFCDALAQRLAKAKGEVYASSVTPPEEYLKDSLVAYQALNEACPYFKFAHLTANQAILEAFEDSESVHIIDFGITEGVQWAALLQALASRPRGRPPPKVRITGIGAPKAGCDTPPCLLATGRRLHSFAELLSLQFEFCPIVAQMDEVNLEMLQVHPGEQLAVNFMLQLYQQLGDGSLSVQPVLSLVNSLKPAVVTLTEYDAALNGPTFQPRFMDALHFYCAIFDSLDATMLRDCQDRLNIESLIFAKEIENIVACEGDERKERHENLESWISTMQSVGFQNSPLSHYANSQAQQLLWLYCDSFRLLRISGCLSLGWQDRPLLTVSAWRCS